MILKKKQFKKKNKFKNTVKINKFYFSTSAIPLPANPDTLSGKHEKLKEVCQSYDHYYSDQIESKKVFGFDSNYKQDICDHYDSFSDCLVQISEIPKVEAFLQDL